MAPLLFYQRLLLTIAYISYNFRTFVLIMKHVITTIILFISVIVTYGQEQNNSEIKDLEKSNINNDSLINIKPFAWKTIPPLGLQEPTTIDTTLLNYYHKSIPSQVTSAYATTGNLGAEGQTMLFFERDAMSDFFFRDALETWIPSIKTHKFYNSRQPMTLLSYNTGGSKETTQDRLKMEFTGNANAKTQIGAYLDYIYSKGSYNYQATKDLIWGASASHMGERYELQAYIYHYNLLNKESGGITDDLYITDPAEVQGGSSKVDTKTIPTHLSAAHSKIVGTDLFINNRYKVGY